jgi:homocysteine S-methyltransferase
VSYRNAEFMNNEVPGAYVPELIMERMRRAPDAAAAREEGIAIARETLAAIRDRVQGVQISAPFGRVQHAIRVIEP